MDNGDMTPTRSLAGTFSGALGHDVTDRRIDILRRVGQCGSISQAAREAGVSYKAAWQAIDTLTNLAGVPLVESSVGGSGGGGARITPAGEQLLHAADALVAARRSAGANRLPAGLHLRTSMRNQLPATVAQLKTAGRIVDVAVALADGTRLASRITRESAELLGLAAGLPVLVLCKATAVTVLLDAPGAVPGSAFNALVGTAARVSRGKSGDEVSLMLAGGLQLVGFAAAGSGVRKGVAVWAVVEPSAVVIALPE
jgi:molybdate transport system regulatory protein